MGALYAAISGLNAEQTALNVVAENIANTNTVGYKSSSLSFAEALLQTLSAGSAPSPTLGGTNPIQVAAGSAVSPAAVAVNMAQGSLQATGNNTDMAIQGAGFFVVRTASGGYAYTRAGNFHLDANGQLVTAQGDPVLGWTAAQVTAGQLTPQNLTSIVIPTGKTLNANASTTATLTGNLNSTNTGVTGTGSGTAQGTSYSVPMTLYDQAGNPVNVTMTFSDPTSPASGVVQWTVNLYQAGSTTSLGTDYLNISTAAGGPAPYWASGAGSTTDAGSASWTIPATGAFADGSPAVKLTIKDAEVAGMTSYASSTTAQASPDGNPAGVLVNFSVQQDGTIEGTFSNGETASLGMVALAGFNNPAGLLNIGNNLWQQSNDSGVPVYGAGGKGGRGTIADGSLEESNVNLSNQFVNMIVAQQGYQANAKVITVDQVLKNTLIQSIQ